MSSPTRKRVSAPEAPSTVQEEERTLKLQRAQRDRRPTLKVRENEARTSDEAAAKPASNISSTKRSRKQPDSECTVAAGGVRKRAKGRNQEVPIAGCQGQEVVNAIWASSESPNRTFAASADHTFAHGSAGGSSPSSHQAAPQPLTQAPNAAGGRLSVGEDVRGEHPQQQTSTVCDTGTADPGRAEASASQPSAAGTGKEAAKAGREAAGTDKEAAKAGKRRRQGTDAGKRAGCHTQVGHL